MASPEVGQRRPQRSALEIHKQFVTTIIRITLVQRLILVHFAALLVYGCSCASIRHQEPDCRLIIVDSVSTNVLCAPDADWGEYLLPSSGVTSTFHSVVGMRELGVAIRARDSNGSIMREFRLPVRLRYYDMDCVAITPRESCAAWYDRSSRNIMILDLNSMRCEPLGTKIGDTNSFISRMEWVDESVLLVAWSSGVITRLDRARGAADNHFLNYDSWHLRFEPLAPNRKHLALMIETSQRSHAISILDAASMMPVTNLMMGARRRVSSLAWDIDSDELLYTIGDCLYSMSLSGAERLVYKHPDASGDLLYIQCVSEHVIVIRHSYSGKYACFMFDRHSGLATPTRTDAYSWQHIQGTSKLVYRTGP